jgi:FtsP/CotA-like multicopper oxidase with cupredoxin domain/plastocyanin
VAVVAVATVGAAGLPGGSTFPLALQPAAAEAPTTAWIYIGQTDFQTKAVSMATGGTLNVRNNATIKHTVTSDLRGSDGKPLFDVTVLPGQTVSISAAADLVAGSYPFHCSIHPTMRGTLTIEGSGGGVEPTRPSFDQPFVRPPVLTGKDIRIPIKRADVQVFPTGPKTRMWTYGGTYPGPTIRRPAGHDTKVRFVNRLPRAAGALSVHLHGDHHASKHDGRPTTELIGHGSARTYDYPLTDGGVPERAAFNWYHDHRMNRTARNNWLGLQGMFLVSDGKARQLGLPGGRYDVPIMVSERSFTDDNQLARPFPKHADMTMTGPDAPPNDATVGDTVLANGRYAPYLRVSTHRYRLRLLNTSPFTAYDFHLSDGQPFVQIATGNGLLPKPVVRQDLFLGPAQRAEVVVDFHGELGKRIVLESVPRVSNPGGDGVGSPAVSIMEFRVTRSADHDDTVVPASLLRAPRLDPPDRIAKTWRFDLGGDPSTGTYWTVNGKPFDPWRVDHRVTIGTQEKWRLVNDSPMTHFVHLHEEQWRTLLRNGKRPPAWERGLEDTWRLDPGESVVVAARFTDHTGRFMLHCHMLDHEDHGLMATFQVVAPRAGTRTSAAAVTSPLLRNVLTANSDTGMTADDLMCRTRRRTRAS